MKKFILPIFTLTILSFFVSSCGSDSDAMVGTWKASSAKVESSALESNMLTLIEAEYAKTELTFGANGEVTLKRGQFLSEGIFSIDDAKNLKLSSAEGAPNPWSEEFNIKSQSATAMTLTSDIDAKGSSATIELSKAQ